LLLVTLFNNINPILKEDFSQPAPLLNEVKSVLSNYVIIMESTTRSCT